VSGRYEDLAVVVEGRVEAYGGAYGVRTRDLRLERAAS
jgi:hypothetical protein